jgi:hypothetical protein
LESQLPWLSQGDIFSDVPLLGISLNTTTGELDTRWDHGPALLITHGCAMDKASSRDRPTIKRLHFLPLAAVDIQDPTRRDILRRDSITPYEVLYIGQCGHLGEVFATLSEVYYLPASFFQPQLAEFSGHEQAQLEDRYLIATKGDSRIGRLDSEQVEKLKSKMMLYWTRRQPVDMGVARHNGALYYVGRLVKAPISRVAGMVRGPISRSKSKR